MSGYPLKQGELMQSETSEGWTIYEPESDSLHVLNDSARAIWELCDGETSPSEMATAISDLTGLQHDQALKDVHKTLRLLDQLGLTNC